MIPPILKRKRGRPPKVKVLDNTTVVEVKRKRGRPRKNLIVGEFNFVDTPKPKRGRPKKAASVKPVAKKEIKHTKVSNDNYVAGKMFIHNKRVSKQEPWFENWENSLWQSIAKKDWETLSAVISELQENLNKLLKSLGEPVLSVHIPLTRLMQDEEILQIIFDPVNRGVDLKIFYRSKDFPLGLTPSMKATAVCNKITEMIKSYVPVGVSG